MFYQTIKASSVPLAGEDADIFFEHINGQKVMMDVSFVATLRALLGKRIGDRSMTFLPQRMQRNSDIDTISPLPSTIQLIYCNAGNSERTDAMIDKAQERIGAFGFAKVEKVTQWLSRAFKCFAWSCEDQNAAIILTGPMDMKKLHILQATIPVVMPWYFKPNESGEKFTDLEKELLSSLEQKDEKPYLAAIAKIAAQYDMREFIVRKRLGGITKRFHEIGLRNMENEIHEIERRIRDYFQSIEEQTRMRNDAMTRLYGLKAQLDKDDEGNDLIDYFLNSKGMFLHGVNGTRVSFTAAGHMSVWDEDSAESIVESLDSYPYRYAERNGFDKERFQKFLRAIFIDRTLKIRMYADYYIDLEGSVDTEHFSNHDPEIYEYFPNPHIENFDCLGNYKRAILECLQSGNTLAAFQYCYASAGSITWSDGIVMERFFQKMTDEFDAIKCYEAPDGTVMAINQAIDWAVENS